eukprot:TRINITY_DN20720_c0_g1_i1.p1 TRINITY_DN20720_c0_g1~~TRINITY_DN20720_c0_g1_i1.p1  ORF type:complete len:418 (+),score=69.48 TRINITY_DN20720_c0_g1_i1:141-1394(+)
MAATTISRPRAVEASGYPAGHRRSELRDRLRRSREGHGYKEGTLSSLRQDDSDDRIGPLVRRPPPTTAASAGSQRVASRRDTLEHCQSRRISQASQGTEYWEDDTVDLHQQDAARALSCRLAERLGVLPRPALPWVPSTPGVPASESSRRTRRIEDDLDWFLLGGCCTGRNTVDSSIAQACSSRGYPPPDELDIEPVRKELALCCNAIFDPHSSDTDVAFKEIWNAACPTKPIVEADDGPRWMKLGFHSSKPRMDVCPNRFSLDQLRFLATLQPVRFRELVREALESGYPLAITCFNITHMVLVFFDLYEFETVSPVPGVGNANGSQLRNFLELCRLHGARNVLNELFRVLVEFLHASWKQVSQATACKNVKFLARSLNATYEANANFWNEAHSSIDELAEVILQQFGSDRHGSLRW